MFDVKKIDGKFVGFDINKISDAIKSAFEAQEVNYNDDLIDFIALKVTADFESKIKDGHIAVEDIQHIVWRLKYRNIGILITDHNVQETLTITDRAYLLFEGKILFQGNPEQLAENQIVKEKYLGTSFVLRKKDFQLIDEQKRARETAENA